MRGRVSLRRRGERDAAARAAGLGDEIRTAEAGSAELALGLHRSVAAGALRGQEQIQQSAGSTQQQERDWGHAAGGQCEPARPGYAAQAWLRRRRSRTGGHADAVGQIGPLQPGLPQISAQQHRFA